MKNRVRFYIQEMNQWRYDKTGDTVGFSASNKSDYILEGGSNGGGRSPWIG